MANEEHSALTGSSLHENKGVSSASDNTVLTVVSGATVCAKLTASNLTGTGNPFGASLLHVQDEKSTSASSGTFSSGAWRKRDLTTVKTNEITSASLTSSVISLPAGTYHAKFWAPGFKCGTHQAILMNTTASTELVVGSVESSPQSVGSILSNSYGEARFTIGVTSNIELQHQCGTTQTTNGYGVGGYGSSVDVYARLYIWKVL